MCVLITLSKEKTTTKMEKFFFQMGSSERSRSDTVQETRDSRLTSSVYYTIVYEASSTVHRPKSACVTSQPAHNKTNIRQGQP